MAKYEPINNLLTTLLSVNFYTADTIDTIVSNISDDISSLNSEMDDMLNSISVEINPKIGAIADEVSAHVEDVKTISTMVDGVSTTVGTISTVVDNLSTTVDDLSTTVNGLTGMSEDVNDLKAINAQLTGITTLATDGSVSILSVIAKVNEIIGKFSKQS